MSEMSNVTCEKLATVHLTQIVDKQIHKIICEKNAPKKGVADPEGFPFQTCLATPQLGGWA